MIDQLKVLLAQKKAELKSNSHKCVNSDLEEIEQEAIGVELVKIIGELTTLLETFELPITIDITDIDGKQLKLNSIIQMLDEDEEPYDAETSSIRLVLDDDRYSIRAFEKNHSFKSISNDTYSQYFRIVGEI